MEQFARFKRANARVSSTSEYGEDDGVSEGRDNVNGLPTLLVVGGKRRRKEASDALGYSLTRSSMFRNRGFQRLMSDSPGYAIPRMCKIRLTWLTYLWIETVCESSGKELGNNGDDDGEDTVSDAQFQHLNSKQEVHAGMKRTGSPSVRLAFLCTLQKPLTTSGLPAE